MFVFAFAPVYVFIFALVAAFIFVSLVALFSVRGHSYVLVLFVAFVFFPAFVWCTMWLFVNAKGCHGVKNEAIFLVLQVVVPAVLTSETMVEGLGALAEARANTLLFEGTYSIMVYVYHL